MDPAPLFDFYEKENKENTRKIVIIFFKSKMEIGQMIIKKDLEKKLGQMETRLKDIIKMERKMEKENIFGVTDQPMMENC